MSTTTIMPKVSEKNFAAPYRESAAALASHELFRTAEYVRAGREARAEGRWLAIAMSAAVGGFVGIALALTGIIS